ncbi:ribonuclease H-like superfamily protein [Striga asiatica]|uniref:Ribonuclease H-like superfamily protein n=1 Tax=Striga asiatica TaxID=4170 RepID=A0A5A7R7T1_STRAF|nr:ribonuclease H-like superfamily protein [Striga asiatica]
MKAGFYSQIGNGKNTFLWADPWVAGLPYLHPVPLSSSIYQEMAKVSDLLNEAGSAWNSELILKSFPPHEAHLILHTSVSRGDQEDKWSWKFSKNGRRIFWFQCLLRDDPTTTSIFLINGLTITSEINGHDGINPLLQRYRLANHSLPANPNPQIHPTNRIELEQERHQALVHPQALLLVPSNQIQNVLLRQPPLDLIHLTLDILNLLQAFTNQKAPENLLYLNGGPRAIHLSRSDELNRDPNDFPSLRPALDRRPGGKAGFQWIEMVSRHAAVRRGGEERVPTAVCEKWILHV